MALTGICYFYICGHHLDVELINSKIGVPIAELAKEGMPDEYGGVYQRDSWWIEVSFSNDFSDWLNSLLAMLTPAQEFISSLSSCYDISILCSISSDLAQIGLTLSAEILCVLSRLGIRLDISILSWGEVVDENSEERRLITDIFPHIIAE